VQPFASLFAKIDSHEKIDREYRAYNTHVAPRLAPGGYAPYADRVSAGAGRLGGIFFRLADAYVDSAFDVLRREEAAALAVLQRTGERTANWKDARTLREMPVRDIRRLLLPDTRLASVERFLAALPWRAVEAINVTVHSCSQHGDLHPLNVLVDAAGEVVLVDFAHAADAPASLDPLTLELALVFHPDLASDWPSAEQLAFWWKLDEYLVECPYPAFVRACREWAHEVAGSDGEVAAVAYAYGIRQLRWSGARDRALALIEAVIPRLT
jgi:hypothetical protein